jgi:hypothetical protein
MRGVLLSFAVAIGMALVSAPSTAAASDSQITAPIYALQQQPAPEPAPAPDPAPDLNVDLDVDRGGTVWYTDPVWLVLGGLGLLIVILLIVFAVRGNGTTIVKD